MSDQPPKTGTARTLWELDDDESEEHFEGGGRR
jgi:hypothetical protein